MKRFRVYIWPLVCLLMAVLLNILSSSDFFDAFIVENMKIPTDTVKSWITIINNLVFVAPLCFMSVQRGGTANNAGLIRERYCEKQRENVYAILKSKGYIQSEDEADFNVRVFHKRLKHLVSEDIDGMYDMPIRRRLSFSIDKNEGLCVKAYKERTTMAEFEDASDNKYNLNQQQKASAGALRFMVVVPVCSENSNKVKYVICFDSFKKIALKKDEGPIMRICERAAYEIYDVIRF